MYIKKLILNNFRNFYGKNILEFKPGLNYIAGNNNAGKTTIFRSISFLLDGKQIEGNISKGIDNDLSVTAVLAGFGKHYELSKKDLSDFLDNGEMIIQKSSNEDVVNQNGKEVKLNIKTIRLYNFKNKRYENPFGASKTAKELLNPLFLYADEHNEDFQNFGATKILGQLINSQTKNFQEKSPDFKTLESTYKKVFGQEGIKKELQGLLGFFDSRLKKQFGEANSNWNLDFDFEFPSINSLLKQGEIVVHQGDVTTNLLENGSGLQRAFANVLLQANAEFKGNEEYQYLLDEPELFLHPQAQNDLLSSLKKLSEKGNQIFITTHSPYILNNFDHNKDSINILNNDNNNERIERIDDLIFEPISVGEISYRAFHIPSVDFHQRLFTRIYLHWVNHVHNKENNDKEELMKKDFPSIHEGELKEFDNYLQQFDITKSEFRPRYSGKWKDKEGDSLSYVIRNVIDHPETLEDGNNENIAENLYTSLLKRSTQDLITVYNKIYKKNFTC